jgi:hypothetical protein
MKRPRTATLMTGHPLVAAPLCILHAVVGVACTYSAGFGWGTLYCLVFIAWVTNCAKEAARYRAWKREWDALDPDHRPPARLRGARNLIGAAVIVGGGYWLFATYGDPASPAHLIVTLLAFGAPVLAVAALLLRRRRRGSSTPQPWFVSQAISRPLPAPSVAEAFARLPDYCRSPTRKDHA